MKWSETLQVLIDFNSVYMPAKEDGSASSDSNLEYDEDAASYFWGIHIPKADVPYKDVSDIPDRLEFCMSYMRNWAPELLLPLLFRHCALTNLP